MYREYRIAVVMPIHNEQNHLARAIHQVPSFVDSIIAVDDGSSDATWKKLCRIEDARLIRLRHEKNLGVGAATKTGYKHSLQTEANFIAVMDGDGQMDGSDLSRLLDAAIDGADYVKGNRFLSKTISCMPLARFVGNKFFSFCTRLAASFVDSIDAQCGYTVIRQDALKRLQLESLYDRYGFPNEMFFAVCRAGFQIKSIPVRAIYDDEVSGINPFTTVPVICYLIARNYLRRRFLTATAKAILVLQESESNSLH